MLTNQYTIFTVALVLAIFSALNLGFVAWSKDCHDDLVHSIVPTEYARWVYGAVGVAGLVLAFLVLFRNIFHQRQAITGAPQKAVKSATAFVTAVKRKMGKSYRK